MIDTCSALLKTWLLQAFYKKPLSPVPSHVAEDLVAKSLMYHRIGPFLYPSLVNSELPSSIKDSIRDEYRKAVLFYDYASAFLKKLRADIDGPDPILIQGIALIEAAYENSTARLAGDVDIIVLPGQQISLCKALHRKGFSQYRTYEDVWAKNGFYIDIHTDIWGESRIPQRKNVAPFTSIDTIASRCIDGYRIPSLPHLAMHSAYHAVKHGFSRLLWDFDLFTLSHKLREEGLYEQCMEAVIFSIAEDHLYSEYSSVDKFTIEHSRIRNIGLFTKWLLTIAQNSGSGELLLALLCKDFRQALLYITGSLFPPKHILQQMYGQKPYPLLLLDRAGALANLGFRACT